MTILSSWQSAMFSSCIPDLYISTSENARLAITMTLDGTVIYSETLYADEANTVEVSEVDAMITPLVEQTLAGTLELSITEQTPTSSGTYTDGSTLSESYTIYYCSARVEETAAVFAAARFLTRIDGAKTTAQGRLEYLHYYGSDTASCTAYYTDGTNAAFTPATIGGNDLYKTIDVSPSTFATSGKTLAYYVVTAGSRTQEFQIDYDCPDCAPILAFTNCFGVQELAYCTGTLEVSPEVKYTQNYVRGVLKTQGVVEVRTMKADTGILTYAMADWLQDLFTSKEIYLVEMVGGTPNVSEYPIAITDCTQSYTNDHDHQPRFTFDYRRSTRNTSIIPVHRSGRIFDTSFDFTFN